MASRDETLELATYFSYLTYDDLPLEVIHHAKASILNALGCAIGAVNDEPSRKALVALVRVEDRAAHLENRNSYPRECSVPGRQKHVDLNTAAFLNGIAITSKDFDDTHLRTVVHPSGTPLAAILPWAEKHHASGKDLILAFVVGVEAQIAVANAISPSHYKDGWHITSTTGTFGAAAGIAKLMNLLPEEFAACLGHCTSMAAGTRAVFGTDTKILHMGRGAQNGILAATLANQFLGSCPSAIEQWAKLVSSTVHPEKISALARGGEWQILQNTFKPYPCGIFIHPLIDGCLEARKYLKFVKELGDPDFVAEGIKEVEVLVNPQCIRLCNVRHPTSALETVFSLYHACAVTLVHGRAGVAEFSETKFINDPAVKVVRDKIIAIPSDGIGDAQATLTFRLWGKESIKEDVPFELTTRDMSYLGVVEHVEYVEHALGSLGNPMTDEMLEDKFMTQARPGIGADRARAAIKGCWALDQFAHVGGFVSMFVPGCGERETERIRARIAATAARKAKLSGKEVKSN